MPQKTSRFIPAKENTLFLKVFGTWVRWMFHLRFHGVVIHQAYHPPRDRVTLYYANHTSWWDALIPLLLNQTRFKQQARAMMDLEQVQNHLFFSWIGVFSVDLSHPRGSIRSLRYALESFHRPQASLFLYPEGELNHPLSEPRIHPFKPGMEWLIRQAHQEGILFDVVPMTIHMHTMESQRPECVIHVGPALEAPETLTTKEFEQVLKRQYLADIDARSGTASQ
ncbi:MAG: lysophospholipid acyltransferase family protein [Balneolaceae bacterium]|nr:lysophospholipid acyltransferase family protein [Balneolaceae bacterium]